MRSTCDDCARRNAKHSPAAKVSKFNYNHRRRVATRSGEKIIPAIVYSRDDYRCGLCGELLAMNEVAPHPLSASVDHIIPLARGGMHTWDNVQAAHFLCNAKKSDKLVYTK
jgi:5-methylcytosine-specific restriction endonuclease McrA